MPHIPLKEENPKGLHAKYLIRKIVGWKQEGFFGMKAITKAVDKNAEYFIMRLDEGGKDIEHIKACRIGVHSYANAIENHLPELAKDLRERYPLLDTPPVSANEWIVCSAIQYFVDGKEVVVCGLRHNNCIKTYYELTGRQTGSELEQGFLTSTGRFVDRIEAGKIALSCGQIKELKYYGGTKLDSSDLYHSFVAPVSAMEDGWVKAETPPETNERVLCLCDTGLRRVGYFYKNEWEQDGPYSSFKQDGYTVTHWHPLPPPPSNR